LLPFSGMASDGVVGRNTDEEPNMFTSFFEDIADAFHPVATGDFGSFFSVLGVAKQSKSTTDAFDAGLNAQALEGEPVQKSERRIAEEKRSLALIELLQKAIERREAALNELHDEPGVPAAQVYGAGTPINRLSLEANTDEALAREVLGFVDMEGERVDMTDLLPPDACATDPTIISAEATHETLPEDAQAEAVPPGAPAAAIPRPRPLRGDVYSFSSTSLNGLPRPQSLAALEPSSPPRAAETTGSLGRVQNGAPPTPTGVTNSGADAPSDSNNSSADTEDFADDHERNGIPAYSPGLDDTAAAAPAPSASVGLTSSSNGYAPNYPPAPAPNGAGVGFTLSPARERI